MTESRRLSEPAAEPLAEVRVLFHRLWTKAHDAPNYDKAEWLRLEGLLAQLGVRI